MITEYNGRDFISRYKSIKQLQPEALTVNKLQKISKYFGDKIFFFTFDLKY